MAERIREALGEFNELNEKIYLETMDTLALRDGISEANAVSYFHLMQIILNGYFSSPAFQGTALPKKVEMHEMLVPKLLNCMLYGIAKGEK